MEESTNSFIFLQFDNVPLVLSLSPSIFRYKNVY